MKVLRAQVTDFDKIAALFDQYRQFYNQSSNLSGAREFVRTRLEKGESVIFYVSKEQDVLGFAQLYPTFSSLAMKRLWILNDLFVSPSARSNGVARLLIQEAEAFARDSGARGITLKTARDNAAAQRLYEATGWQRDERFCCYDKPLR